MKAKEAQEAQQEAQNRITFMGDCGHCDGCTKEDFEMLLQQPCKSEGKFLLSSYPSDILAEYMEKCC